MVCSERGRVVLVARLSIDAGAGKFAKSRARRQFPTHPVPLDVQHLAARRALRRENRAGVVWRRAAGCSIIEESGLIPDEPRQADCPRCRTGAGRCAASRCRSSSTRIGAAMIDHTTNPGSEEHESIERYDLEVAPRVRGLPPYLFGKINELKYRKRRAGIDVIDLGMGNPDRPARRLGHRQALRGRPRPAEPPLQRRHRRPQPPPRGRRSATSRGSASRLDPDHEVVATIGSKEGFSHMCLALLGPGRHRPGPRAELPDPRPRHRPGLGQRDLAGRPGQLRAFLANIARTCESLYPAAQDPGPELSAQPDGDGGRAGVLRGDRRAGAGSTTSS